MKRIIIFSIALCLGALSQVCPAQARWLATSHDFGAFTEESGPVSCPFRFVNAGSKPIVVVAARASCGCTTPDYTREAIAPGDTGTVVVTYDPAGRPGRFSKYVAVDVSNSPKAKLIVKGTVVGSSASVAGRFPVDGDEAIKLSRSAVMFGQMKKNTLRTATIDIYNRSTDTIRPLLSGMPPHIDVTVAPAAVAPGEQASLLFYFRSNRTPLYGLVSDSVALRSRPEAAAVMIPVMAFVEEDFSKLTPKDLDRAPQATLAPTSLDYGTLSRTGEPVTMKAEIKNTGKTPLIIRRVYSTDPGVSVDIDRDKLKHGKTAVITATVDPAALPGDMLNARVSVITNDPEKPVQILRLVGILR